MSQLRRMLLSNVGYKSAYYPDTLLNFCHPETQEPENTVLWLANQGGKTTLISLLFTNIEPAQKRFVQHLQKPDHHFSDYFYPTPGIIALELQTGSSDLLGTTPPLVIGQCVVVKDKETSQRLFFGFHENDKIKLDDLPFKGAGSDRNPADMAEFRKWLNQAEDLNKTFFHTEKQDEWKKLLDSKGVEHDLLAKQIDFCRSEGGISDFASFKDEHSFLEQFFKLAIDEGTANQAHETLHKAKTDFKEIPILEEKQKILEKLVKCFQQLQPLAQHYQQYTTKIQEQDTRLRTLGEQIQLRLLWLDQQIDSFKNKATQTAQQLIVNQTNLNDLENAIKQTIFTLKVLEQTQAAQKLEEVQNLLIQTEEELALTKAVIALDDLEKVLTQQTKLTQQINSASSEIEPVEKLLKQSGSHLIAAYEQQSRTIKQNLEHVIGEIKNVDNQINKSTIHQESINKQLESQRKISLKAEQWFEIYEEQLTKLAEKNHLLELDQKQLDVIQANEYWKEILTNSKSIKTSITEIIEQNKNELKKKQTHVACLSETITTLATSITHLEDQYNTAQKKREILENNTELCKLIQVGIINPDDLTVQEKLNQYIENLNSSITSTNQKIEDLLAQKDSLENDRLAKPDTDIETALAYLTEQGLEAKYFPHYLASQNLKPEDAQTLVESDPARFYGIQVNNLSATHNALREINRKELGLSRPIVISESCIEIETSHDHFILPVRNDAAYNEEAADVLLLEINSELSTLEDKQTNDVNELENHKRIQFDLKTYQEQYGATWLQNKKTEIENKIIEKNGQEQQNKETLVQISDIESIQQELSTNLEVETENHQTAQSHVDAIEHFIESYETDKAGKISEKTVAEKLISSLTIEHKQVESCLTEFSEKKTSLEEKQNEITDNLEENKISISKVIYKLDLPIQLHDSHNIKQLEQEYSTNQEIHTNLLHEKGLSSLEGKLDLLNAQVEERQKNYEQSKGSLTTKKIKEKQQHLHRNGINLHKEESNLGEQEKTLIESVGQHKGKQDSAVHEVNEYHQKHPEISELTEPSTKGELTSHLKEQEDSKKDIDKIIDKLTQSIDDVKTKSGYLESEKRIVSATIKQLPDDLFGSLPIEQDLSIAENIISDDISTQLAKANKDKSETLNKRSFAEKEVKQLFDTQIAPIVQNPENKSLLGVIAIDINNLSIHQLINKPKHNFDTLQEVFLVVENKIQTNKKKLDFINSSLDRLLFEADDALHQAFKVRIPADMQHYSKKPILKSRLETKNKLRNSLSSKQRHDLYHSHIRKIVETESIDENGYKLAANFLLNAYETVLAVDNTKQKNGLNIKIIKPDDVEVDYIPVNKMIGSGGEGLTAGILLYLVIANIRNLAMGKGSYDSHGSFLLLDNPFSKANKVDLIRPQTTLAKNLGIQLIFATGIEDLNAVGEFEHIIRLRKARRDMHTKRQYVEIEEKNRKEPAQGTHNWEKYKIESAEYSFSNAHEKEVLQ